jgi:hypothetical protein
MHIKSKFTGYYRPSEEEFRTLWNSCVFFVDANVLLNLYAYSEGTRGQMLTILETISTRLRIPHQFALEYQRNRARAIMQQVMNYVRVEKILRDVYDREFAPKLKHPFLSDEMKGRFDSIRAELRGERENVEGLFRMDPYHDRITEALAGRVGDAPDGEKLNALHDRAAIRYAAAIPPGYEDTKEKEEPDAYGDYVGWAEILEMAKSEDKAAILITDDSKADWWQLQGDRTIGPRPELVAEFVSEVNQQFYMYTSPQFLKFSTDYLESKVEDDAIQEMKRRLEEKRRLASERKSAPTELGIDAKSAPPSETSTSPLKPAFLESSDTEPPADADESQTPKDA